MLFGWGILLLIAAILAVSSYLPRTPQDMISFSEGNGAVILDFLFKLGVYDSTTFKFTLIETWWFKILLVLAGIFFVKALLKIGRDSVFNKKPEASKRQFKFKYIGSKEEAQSFLAYGLKNSGFKVDFESDAIIAYRVKAYTASLMIIHIGLLLTLIGGIHSYSSYEKGSLNLPQGVRVSAKQIEGIKIEENFEIEAEMLWPQYYSVDEFGGAYNGLIKDYFAKLKILENQQEKSVVAATSQSRKINQFGFFLSDYGATGILSIKDGEGQEYMDVFPIEYQQGLLMGSYVSKDNIGFSVNYTGIPDKNGQQHFSYSIYEYTNTGWQEKVEGKEQIFKPILYKGKEYVFQDVNRVAIFTVVKTSTTILYSGLVVFLAGVALFLFVRQIKLKFDFSLPQQVVVEGWSLPDNLYFYKQVDKLSQKLRWEEL